MPEMKKLEKLLQDKMEHEEKLRHHKMMLKALDDQLLYLLMDKRMMEFLKVDYSRLRRELILSEHETTEDVILDEYALSV